MIAQFSLRLILGMCVMWCIMPRAKVTSGFFRIQMLVAMGLAVLAAMSYEPSAASAVQGSFSLPNWSGPAACATIAGLAFLGSVLWTLQRRQAGTLLGALMGLLTAALLFGSSLPAVSVDSPVPALWILSEVSTALILGSALTGMLLGHWYLTSPSMSIEPLRRLTLYFGLAATFRMAVSGIGLVTAWDRIVGPTAMTWLVLRWVAGILGPIVVALMVLRILKYRNTQSATGVMFAGVILAFIGELTASLLYHEIQVPL